MTPNIRDTDAARRVKLFARSTYAKRVGPPLSRWRPGMVVMFHIGRSGSSVLSGMLRQHPAMFWSGEIFRTHLEQHEVTEQNFEPSQLTQIPAPDLRRLCEQSGPLFYGMEVKFFHLDLFALTVEQYLRDLIGVGMTHLIILERRNYLSKVVSSVRAHDDGRYHVARRDTSLTDKALVDLSGDIKIDYSSKSLHAHLEGYRLGFSRLRAAADTLGVSPLELTYEDHISADPTIGYRMVCDHVGVRPRSAQPALRRISQSNLQSQLADVADVERQLAGSDFEWMLNT